MSDFFMAVTVFHGTSESFDVPTPVWEASYDSAQGHAADELSHISRSFNLFSVLLSYLVSEEIVFAEQTPRYMQF